MNKELKRRRRRNLEI